MSLFLSKVTENTIFHALDTQRIESEKNKPLSFCGKVKKGVFASISTVCKLMAFHVIADPFIKKLFYDSSDRAYKELGKHSFYDLVIKGPIKEELLVRGIFQTSMRFLQSVAQKNLPPRIKNHPVFQKLFSPSARIFAVGTLFAALHLANVRSFSTAEAVSQVISFFTFPVESILFETTDSLIAPIAEHMTNNCIGWLILQVANLPEEAF